MKTSEILDRAADLIERNGWTRDEWYKRRRAEDPRDCPVCAGGALDAAAGCDPGEPEYSPALIAAIGAFAARVDPAFDPAAAYGYGTVANWNDAPGRTAEDVVRELRAAAATEREAQRAEREAQRAELIRLAWYANSFPSCDAFSRALDLSVLGLLETAEVFDRLREALDDKDEAAAGRALRELCGSVR